MRSQQSRNSVVMKFAAVAGVGICVGLVVGFGFMSIVDTVQRLRNCFCSFAAIFSTETVF